MVYSMAIEKVGTATYKTVQELAEALQVHFDNYEEEVVVKARAEDSNKTYPLLELCT